MSKETAIKATFKDLINKKIQREKDQVKVKEIYVSSMDKTLTFVKPKEDKIIDLMDDINDQSSMKDQINFTRKLIYFSCPMLQDPEFHKELGVQDPLDIVPMLFDMNDTNEIGEELTELIGNKKVVEDIKNS
ncbi:hypothetical protein [Clostridium butyricum]|uniref:hypothetical protein n=1 Tax=Clostridium butyricum TaxID=1492 RepID=UPI002ABD4666|nr:hypothetical protein [Clostridium butyricum]